MHRRPKGPTREAREPASKKPGSRREKTSAALVHARNRLVAAKLRPTRQRVALLHLLVADGDRHVTPDKLWAEAQLSSMHFTLATIYNGLNDFTEAGLLRRIVVGPGQVFFDTNTTHHHHIYHEDTGELRSVPARQDGLVDLPGELARIDPERLDVIVRVRAERPDAAAPGNAGSKHR